MKHGILALGLLLGLCSVAHAEQDLVDNCGTLTRVEKDFYTLKSDIGYTYGLVSSEDTSTTVFRKFPDTFRRCIRAYTIEDKPSILELLDHWPYQRSEYLMKCEVSEIVDDSVYEEGLSVHEYPEVEVENVVDSEDPGRPAELRVYIGSTIPYEEAEGDQIKVNNKSRKELIVTAAYKAEKFKNPIELRMDKKHVTVRKGKHTKKVRYAQLWRDGKIVADLSCK